MTKDAIFRIASMTKPVTSVSGDDAGRTGKAEPRRSRFEIPSIVQGSRSDRDFQSIRRDVHYKEGGKEVLIRHLLTNTSGLAYPFANDTSNRLQQKLNKAPKNCRCCMSPEPNGHIAAARKFWARSIEKITGAGLDKFMASESSNRSSCRTRRTSCPPAKSRRVVTTQRRENGKLIETPNPERIQSPVAGDGGLNSTVADYIKFLQMFLNDGKWRGIDAAAAKRRSKR